MRSIQLISLCVAALLGAGMVDARPGLYDYLKVAPILPHHFWMPIADVEFREVIYRSQQHTCTTSPQPKSSTNAASPKHKMMASKKIKSITESTSQAENTSKPEPKHSKNDRVTINSESEMTGCL